MVVHLRVLTSLRYARPQLVCLYRAELHHVLGELGTLEGQLRLQEEREPYTPQVRALVTTTQDRACP